MGAFAVTTGLGIEKWIEHFEKDHDDYNKIMLKALADRLAEAFADQLRSIKTALENRDFVALADALGYEATQTCRQWTSAIQSIRATIE